MIPIAIYARYSTDKQDARSIDDQLRRCREYAERNGYEVVAEFADAATSGAHTERANLRRMLDVATATKHPPFRAVIVDDLSRLSRDLGDTWRIIFTDLAAVDVKVIDASTGMASDASGARTMFAAMAMVNDTFLQLVRHETHRGLQGRALAGFSTGGSLYGYATYSEPNPSDLEHPRKLWAIDEAEAPIVRRIFEMFEEGMSYRAIADELNREHVAAPRNNGRGGKHGIGWCHPTVRAILTNEKYIGRWRWNVSKWIRVPGKRARRQLARPESEHVVREYPDLAVIDQHTWDRVQSRIAKRAYGDERAPRQGQQTTLVSGLLRCGVCGGPMSVRSAKVKAGVRYVNYGCTAHSSRGGSICSNAKTVSEKKVSKKLVAALRVALTDDLQARLKRQFETTLKEESAETPTELKKKLEASRRRVDNAIRLMMEMPDDLDIRRMRENERAEVRRLEAQLAETTKVGGVPDRKKVNAAIAEFLATLSTGSPAKGRDLLARCISPLAVIPKNDNGPDRFQIVGTVDLVALAAGAASESSGGMLGSLIYRISKVKSWTRTLVPYARG